MAELDDGEVWLSSDIVLNEVVPASRFGHRHFTRMDDLAERFAAFTLLQHRRNVSRPPHNLSPNLERFRPAVHKYGTASRAPQEYLSLKGGHEDYVSGPYGYGTGSCFPGNQLLYEYQHLEPSQPQVDVDSSRARVLRTPQNRLQNRLLPFQGSRGLGFGSGFVKESGGTGVFIPRIMNTAATTSGTMSATTADIRKKKVLRNRQEIQVTQQGGSCLKGICVSKQRESYRYLPPEMSLPQDWTY